MVRSYVTVSFLACASAAPLWAQTDDPLDLGTIVVSGGFTPVDIQDYGSSATVIDRSDIEERGFDRVVDALRTVPGMAISGSGNLTQVRIRGNEANQALILIDGIEASAGDSEYDISGIDTANIDRIEVLRGPQSVIYGADAAAGVVNIITRRPEDGLSFGGTVEAGDGHGASAFASGRLDRVQFSFSAADRRRDGYDISGDDGEEDELERTTFTLSGQIDVTEILTLGAFWRESDERYAYDRTDSLAATAEDYVIDSDELFGDRDERQTRFFAELDTLNGRLVHRLSFERTDYDLDANGVESEFETEVARYLATFALDGARPDTANHHVSLLFERSEDTSSTFPDFDRSADSVAVEYRGSFARGLDLQAGLRRTDNDVFEDATTWNVGSSYTMPLGLRLHASAGRGVVNPTFFDLFANSFGIIGNPDLQPETIRGYDLGLEFALPGGRGVVDVTYFNEDLEDEIEYVVRGGVQTYANSDGTSERQGVEVAGEYDLTQNLRIRSAYTYLDATASDGSMEIRRPRHDLTVGASYAFAGGRGLVSGDIRHVADLVDSRFFGDFATVELDDYTVVDLAARYDLTDRVTLSGGVTNVFDTDYTEVIGYASPDRRARVELSARW